MRLKKPFRIGIAVLIISLAAGLSISAVSAQGFTDGFEDDSVGSYPDGWEANGNSDQQVTDSRSASGDDSFRITGSSGGCWEAIANHPVDLPSQGSVEISANVLPTDNGQPGCHGTRNARAHLRTAASGWGQGSNSNLWKTRANGSFVSQGGIVDFYNLNQWNEVDVVYERSNGQVELSYSLNGRQIGTTTRSVLSYEDDISYLAFNSGEYELFIDDVSVSSQNTNDRFEPNDDFSEAEPTTPGSYSDLQIVNGESDYFAVDLSQGDEITASMQFSHSTGDLDLQLHDPDRNQIDSSRSISDNEQVSATAQQSGTYYVEAYGFSGASAPYSLNISVDRNLRGGEQLDVTVTQTDGSGFPEIETFVSATDSSGNTLTGLGATNFEVTEEGSPVTIDNFERVGTGGADVSTSLVLDRSGSMKQSGTDDEDRLVDAATEFVSLFNRGDEAEIINFADVVRTDRRWTSSTSELQNAIEQSVSDDDFTKLYDATVEGIRSAESRQGRSAVIAMTDGENNAGNIQNHQEVIDIAQQNNVPVYTIGLGVSGTPSSFSDSGNGTAPVTDTNSTQKPVAHTNNPSDLREIATETGGEYYETPDSSELTEIYQDISESISNEYRVTYQTPNPQEDGSRRTVEVEITESGETGSDTGSYVAPNTTPPEIPKQEIEEDFTKNGLTVEFDASDAFDPDGIIDEYRWDFTNDGVVDATGEVVTYTYSGDGVYEVKLTLIDNSGVRTQEVFNVQVGNVGGEATINSVTPSSLSSNGEFRVDYTVDGGNSHQVEIVPDNTGASVNVTAYSGNDAFSNLGQPDQTDSRLNPDGVALFDGFEQGTRTVTVRIIGGSVGESMTVEVRNLQDSTVLDTDTQQLTFSDEHPSGVSRALFEAVAEQNADPDTIQRSDVTDMIDKFFSSGEIDGIGIQRSDVTDTIDWFFSSR